MPGTTELPYILDLAILQSAAESYLHQSVRFVIGRRSLFDVVFAGSNNLEITEVVSKLADEWGGAGLTAARACSRFAPPPIG
ncbi:MAG: hypothetical protein HYV17_00445 [Xanthomonadales bacterium]|nr:hypothetical protein [Xanthomonadales bacterium]